LWPVTLLDYIICFIAERWQKLLAPFLENKIIVNFKNFLITLVPMQMCFKLVTQSTSPRARLYDQPKEDLYEREALFILEKYKALTNDIAFSFGVLISAQF